jgi:type I restriction enzyme S subunit
MSCYKNYDSYIPSGLDWLPSMPQGWRFSQVKRGYKVTLGKMLQPSRKSIKDIKRKYLRAANIQVSGVDISDVKEMWFSPKETKALNLEAGDVLVSEGGDVGRSALWNEELKECYFQNSINRVRSTYGNSTEFFNYWLQALKSAGYVDIICNKSTIPHYTAEKVSSSPIMLPPIIVQNQIVDSLNKETARIDALMEKKTRFIELLKEKRQALITQAVTKGLDPTLPMKDSGVDWVGTVPKNWEIKPLKSIAIGPGSLFIDGDWIESKDLSDSGVRYITTGNVGNGIYKEQGTGYITEDTFKKLRCTEVRPGDILISRLNLPIGRACIVPELGSYIVTSVDNVILRPDLGFTKSYLLFLLSSSAHFFNTANLARGTTMQRISRSSLGNIRFPFPPEEEQQKIGDYLKKKTSRIESILSATEQSIELLKERRSSLISAAVTGQIDLRENAA